MRRSIVVVGTLCLVLGLAVGLGADMKSKQKTQVKFEGMLGRVAGMFGGKAVKDGIVSTVAISGDRMMTVNDQSGELVDLAEEKVYSIDFKGKSYKVKTFAEIRKEWEDAQKKMKEQAAEAREEPEQGEVQYEIDFSVEKTGQRKAVNGFDTEQVVMTITVRPKGKKVEEGGGMVMTTDMWMAPKIAAMQEQAAFTQRYMKKLLGSDTETMARDMAQAMAMYPQMQVAMERMKKESVKLAGHPRPDDDEDRDGGVARAGQGEGGRRRPAEGGAGRHRGRHRRDVRPQEEGGGGSERGRARAAGPKNRSTFMTSTTELLEVQASAGAADVEIPAGFKQK